MSLDLEPMPTGTARHHGVITGPSRAAGSNAPIRLHETDEAWLVVSGTLNVFAVPRHGDHVDGAREFLWQVHAGALCFGFAAACDARAGRPAVIAVGEVDTVVAPVTRDDLAHSLALDPESTLARVTAYVDRLHVALDDGVPGVEGEALPSRLSLGGDAIVQADHGVADGLWRSLQSVQHRALAQIAQRVQATDEAQQARLQARRVADRAAEQRARAAMGTLLARTPDASWRSSGSALHDALRLIGAHVGVAFRMPAHEVPGQSLTERARQAALVSTVGCRHVHLQAAWWRQDAGPLLAFTRRSAPADAPDAVTGGAAPASDVAPEPELASDPEIQRPVVLLPGDKGYVAVNPVSGEREAVRADIAARLSPWALQFYRSLPAEPVRTRALLRFTLAGLRGDLRALLSAGVAVATLALVPPVLTRALLDHVIPASDAPGLTAVVLALLVASVSGLLFEWVRAVAVLRVRTRIVHDLQLAILDRLLRLPVSFFKRFAAGDLGLRAMATMTVSNALGQATLTALFGGIAGVTALVLLFWYSVPLALLSTAMLLLNVTASTVVARRAMTTARQRHQALSELSAFMLETLRGMAKIRVAAAESRILARWAVPFRRQQQAQFRFGMLALHLMSFLSVLDVVARLALFALYAWLLTESGNPLSTGGFVAFAAAEGTFRAAVMSLSNTAIALLDEVPVWERAAPLLSAVPESHAERPDPGMLEGHIEIDRLHFAYTADGPDILHDVSLTIPAGSFVAIVGPSGSGKSTLLRLLLGFETPTRGSVRYDGQDLRVVDCMAVRRQIGVVLQNASLSQGDIYSNITGSTPRPPSDVWEATRLAGLEDDVRAMPMGLQTLIPDGGSSLSGGQRQRLLIARALINRPRILLFDEATSALDTRAQRRVSDSVATLKATRVVIAHRLSTVREADRIVVLDNGRIVDSGRYDELMTRGGLFARLAALQET